MIGLVIAVGGVLAGLTIDGGNVMQILKPSAALIVFGGTLGATMLQFPLEVVMGCFQNLGTLISPKGASPRQAVTELVAYANKARKEGVVSLDSELEKIEDPFLKRALMLAVDGTEPQELRKMMELELDNQVEREERIPAAFEAAGGFAPTIGILGAVLGLIQVMGNLNHIDKVGEGIASAFVATIYGVGSANLFFLPAGGKLRIRQRQEHIIKEMMLEGVVSILEGMNPRMLETKLLGFIDKEAEPEAAATGAGAPQAAMAGGETA